MTKAGTMKGGTMIPVPNQIKMFEYANYPPAGVDVQVWKHHMGTYVATVSQRLSWLGSEATRQERSFWGDSPEAVEEEAIGWLDTQDERLPRFVVGLGEATIAVFGNGTAVTVDGDGGIETC